MNRVASSVAQQGMSLERRIGQSEWSAYTRTWWWFVVAGPVIIVGVLVGAGIGIDAWFLGFFAVILAFLLIAVGLTLGLAHLYSRRGSVARA